MAFCKNQCHYLTIFYNTSSFWKIMQVNLQNREKQFSPASCYSLMQFCAVHKTNLFQQFWNYSLNPIEEYYTQQMLNDLEKDISHYVSGDPKWICNWLFAMSICLFNLLTIKTNLPLWMACATFFTVTMGVIPIDGKRHYTTTYATGYILCAT